MYTTNLKDLKDNKERAAQWVKVLNKKQMVAISNTTVIGLGVNLIMKWDCPLNRSMKTSATCIP